MLEGLKTQPPHEGGADQNPDYSLRNRTRIRGPLNREETNPAGNRSNGDTECGYR